jgi:iron-sulfur cluster assembly accessory protein
MDITVSETAAVQFNKIGGIIRYSLNSGGCSGLIGKWARLPKDTKLDAFDVVVWKSTNEEVTFIVDIYTEREMKGSTVDYTGDPFNPVFKISIPDKHSCGCGESFVMSDN